MVRMTRRLLCDLVCWWVALRVVRTAPDSWSSKRGVDLLPCAAWLEGEYGLSGMYCGVPGKLGKNGLEKIVAL